MGKLSPDERDDLIYLELSAEESNGHELFLWALRNGNAGIINAYVTNLDKLTPELRDKRRLELLSAKTPYGGQGLAIAFDNRNPDGIKAYGALLGKLTPEQRETHLLKLLAAKNKYGKPAFYVAFWYKDFKAMDAYRLLLDMLTLDQRKQLRDDLDGALFLADRPDALKAYTEFLDSLLPKDPLSHREHVANIKSALNVEVAEPYEFDNAHDYQKLMFLLSKEERNEVITEQLTTENSNAKLNFLCALHIGDADRIKACENMLDKLTPELRDKHLLELLSVKFSNLSGLYSSWYENIAWRRIETDVGKACRALLDMLTPDKRKQLRDKLDVAVSSY